MPFADGSVVGTGHLADGIGLNPRVRVEAMP